MIDWKAIDQLPDALKDGRMVLLWTTWGAARAEYPDTPEMRERFADDAVTARWRGDRWALVQAGGYAADDDVNGEITHFAEIQAPAGAVAENRGVAPPLPGSMGLLGVPQAAGEAISALKSAPELFGMGLAQFDAELPADVLELRDRRSGAVLARIENIGPKPD